MRILYVAVLLALCGLCICQDSGIQGKWAPSRDGIIGMNFPNGSDKIKENEQKIDEMMKMTMEITKNTITANGKTYDYVILDQRKDENEHFSRSYYSCKISLEGKILGYLIFGLHEDGELVMWSESSKIGVFTR